MTDTRTEYAVPDDFYRAFEDRFRGSQELIFERLEVYLPFLRTLKAENDAARGLDLGCGRGEWLRMLEREGFEALGVDLDDGMLQAARQHGLTVENKDAIVALTEAADGAFDVISGFHIIEHLPFPTRLALVREACRVLRPGGILILETPNPENVLVGTWSFHLDPTHVAPIPPMLMPFLAEYAGFAQSTILRLHTPAPGDEASLLDVFTTVATDFALVARAAGPENPEMTRLFQTPVGIDVFGALNRFDSKAHDRWASSETDLATLSSAVQERDAEANRRLSACEEALTDLATLSSAVQERDAGTNRRLSACEEALEKLGSEVAGIDIAQRRVALDEARAEIGSLRDDVAFLSRRTLFQMLFFRPSGRPVKLLRRLAFHSNGRPRGGVLLRRIARKKNGTPRPAFARWMASAEYAALPWPASNAARAAPPAPHLPSTPQQHGNEDLLGPVPDSHPRRYEVWARLDSAQRHAGGAT